MVVINWESGFQFNIKTCRKTLIKTAIRPLYLIWESKYWQDHGIFLSRRHTGSVFYKILESSITTLHLWLVRTLPVNTNATYFFRWLDIAEMIYIYILSLSEQTLLIHTMNLSVDASTSLTNTVKQHNTNALLMDSSPKEPLMWTGFSWHFTMVFAEQYYEDILFPLLLLPLHAHSGKLVASWDALITVSPARGLHNVSLIQALRWYF